MADAEKKSSSGAMGPPVNEFWENELEVGTQQGHSDLETEEKKRKWINKLTGRQIEILRIALCHSDYGSVRKNKSAIGSTPDDELFPFVMVTHFASYKSKIAVFSIGQEVLPENMLDICRIKEDDYDKTALLFAIYLQNYLNLRLIFHFDKIHKSGFARMKLKRTPKRPAESLEDFLQTKKVDALLAEFDKKKNDDRSCKLGNVVTFEGRPFLFIRRAERPDHILQDGGIVYGHRLEWITLDFEATAKRVNISSNSVSVPLEIANLLASKYFDASCEYENDREITYTKQLVRFLDELRKGAAPNMTFVELVLVNSPLKGAPKIKITDPASNSIGGAVTEFEKAIGGVLKNVDRVESIKVHFKKKRVAVIFEQQESNPDEYIVRYSDHRLNVMERRAFESEMMDNHAIPVLSTEKRFKDQ